MTKWTEKKSQHCIKNYRLLKKIGSRIVWPFPGNSNQLIVQRQTFSFENIYKSDIT